MFLGQSLLREKFGWLVGGWFEGKFSVSLSKPRVLALDLGLNEAEQTFQIDSILCDFASQLP